MARPVKVPEQTGALLRYCPERELPVRAYVPGHTPHSLKPASEGKRVPWDGQASTLHSSPEHLWAVDLYNHGFYWEAHEVWEELWKFAEPQSTPRYLLQGLIQAAAACLKASTGQWDACQKLSEKGIGKLAKVIEQESEGYLGINLRQFAEKLETYSEARSERSDAPRILLQGGQLGAAAGAGDEPS